MINENVVRQDRNHTETQDQIASILKTDRATLERFEEAYRKLALKTPNTSGDLFETNSRDMSAYVRSKEIPGQYDERQISWMISRIVDELMVETKTIDCLNGRVVANDMLPCVGEICEPVSQKEILKIPKSLRPQLTGSFMSVDIDTMSSAVILSNYQMWKESEDKDTSMLGYHLFRQGLDIVDLDPIVYAILGMNRNTMSYWLPAISYAAALEGFFKIPKTKIAQVPMPLLQLTRKDYHELTPTTLKIVDDWAMKAFELDVNQTYFIKTGTYSSKYDFRNVKVSGEKEVTELGEYLLYIHFQANYMAGPLCKPSIFGASTTNEWVVREFIEDVEGNPCIYQGLPLHTEYRVFVDFDTDEILGISPYWEPSVMLKRFSEGSKDSPHHWHDYVIYKAYEDTLMKRYYQNKEVVLSHVAALLPNVELDGQWSIDIMQNGDDFWLIDMAIAETSALLECVPVDKIRHTEENWIPDLSKTEYITAISGLLHHNKEYDKD